MPVPLSCPRCGIPSRRLSPASQVFVCRGCGAIYEADGSLCQGVQKGLQRQLAIHPFLRIGLQGKLNGESVTVTGRIRYRMQCEEWDAEDHCYTDEQWDYDEWLLSTTGDTYFLSECQGEMELQMAMPSAPLVSLDWAADRLLTEDGQTARVLVRGIATIIGVEGELPWELPDTGRVRILEYEEGKRRGAVEQDIDDTHAPVVEPEYFLGESIDPHALRAVFGISAGNARRVMARAQSPSVQRVGRADKTWRQQWAVRYVFAAIVLFLLGIMTSQGGDVVFTETTDASVWGQQKRIGPVVLDRPGELYEVEVSGRLPNKRGDIGWLGVELEASDDQVVNTVEADLWRDEDESNSSASKIFRLKEAGTYYFRLDGNAGSTSFPATVTVRAGITLSRYYFIASAFLFFLMMLFMPRQHSE